PGPGRRRRLPHTPGGRRRQTPGRQRPEIHLQTTRKLPNRRAAGRAQRQAPAGQPGARVGPKVEWYNGPADGKPWRDPTGMGGKAPQDYSYPKLHVYGVVVGQPGAFQNVDGTAAPGREFKFNPKGDIITNVNDNAYSDNSGF